MSREVVFYGASDDLIEVDDPTGVLAEEYGKYSGDWSAVLTDPVTNDTARVNVAYGNNGTWAAYLSLIDEDVPVPESWKPTIGFNAKLCPYSVTLTLTLPEGIILVPDTKE